MAEAKHFPFTIIGELAAEAVAALQDEERVLDRIYEGIAPDHSGYETARMKILAKIKEEYGVIIR